MPRMALTSVAVLLAGLAPLAARPPPQRPIPRLERVDGRFRLLVDAQPFLVLGAQAHDSSASDAAALGYVDAVAAAGKEAYPLPMYVNAWLVNPGDEREGRWPSGGPTRVALVVSFPRPYDLRGPNGGGLVLELAPDDLLVAGCGIDFVVRDLEAPLVDPHQWATRQPVLSIDEGTFEGERWVPGRRLNGDERWVRLPAEGAILRVRLRLP